MLTRGKLNDLPLKKEEGVISSFTTSSQGYTSSPRQCSKGRKVNKSHTS